MAIASVTATSGGGAMSRAQFEKLTTEGLVLNEVVLDADEQALFRKNKIDGDSLLGMTSLFCFFLLLLDLSRWLFK